MNLSREITDGIHGWKFGQLGTFFYLEEAQQHQQEQESRQDLGHDRQARGSFGVQDGKGGEPGKSSGDIGVGGGDGGDSGSGSGGSDECGESGGGGRSGDTGTGSLAKDDLVSTNLNLNSGSIPSSNQRDANSSPSTYERYKSAPPADGYRALISSGSRSGVRTNDEETKGVPTLMHNWTHRIKHQDKGSTKAPVAWEGGSRLSFDGMPRVSRSRSSNQLSKMTRRTLG